MINIESYYTHYTEQEIEEIINSISEKNLHIDDNFAKILKVKDKIKIFKNISNDKSLVNILLNVKIVRFSNFSTIIKEGSISKEMYYILSGSCVVLKLDKEVGSISAGSSVGEIAAIFDKPRNATIKASGDVVAISFEIDNSKLSKYPLEFAMLYRNIASELIEKLEFASKR